MSEIEEVARATAEASKFGTKALETTEKLASFVAKVFKEPIRDAVGIIGDRLKFKVVSLEPEDHRLGLSIRALGEKKSAIDSSAKEKAEPKDEPRDNDKQPEKENKTKE